MERIPVDDLEIRDGVVMIRGSEKPFTGTSVAYDDLGHVYREIEYRDGIRHGKYTTYWSKWSQERESRFTYRRGVLHGPVRHWHEFGTRWFKGRFVEGKPHGVCTRYFENGEKLGESIFDHGTVVGEVVFWHRNGEKRGIISIGSTPGYGTYSFYAEDGSLEASGEIVDGVLVGSPYGKTLKGMAGWYFFHPSDFHDGV